MNPRQRRGILLIGLAVIGALAVFVSIVNYVSEVQSQVGPVAPVLRLVGDVQPYTPVEPQLVEEVRLPQRWHPANALTDPIDLAGRVSPVALPAGTVLQDGMLVDPPALQSGERELAILVDAETGVAGKIGRGSVVDIYATFGGDSQGISPQSNIVVENASILDVGVPTANSEQNATGGFVEGQVVPVTFALSIDESLRLTYIESFASNVRLALRAPLDNGTIGSTQRTYRPDPAQAGQPVAPAGGPPPPTAQPAAPVPGG